MILFDKSAIEMLNSNEAAVFDCLFSSVLCPIYLIEVLSDLKKKKTSGRTPEKVVSDIALKTPQLRAYPNVLHTSLCLNELLGRPVTMDGRPNIEGARPIKRGSKVGYVYDELSELEAFNRWQEGRFDSAEREFVSTWRKQLETADLAATALSVKSVLKITDTPRNEAEAYQFALEVLNKAPRFELLKLFYGGLALPSEYWRSVEKSWKKDGHRPLLEYAPYTAHCCLVDLFFYIATDKGLISPNRPSNRTDIAYLYYLPFTQCFLSNDKLHHRVVPLFLAKNQRHLVASDLKCDLAKLEQSLWERSDEEKQGGLFKLAKVVRDSVSALKSEIWEYMPSAEIEDDVYDRPSASFLLGTFENIEQSPTAPWFSKAQSKSPDYVTIRRSVHVQRGRWQMFPPNVRKRD